MPQNATDNLSQMAQVLEKSGDYRVRVLRRLVPRNVISPVPADQQIKVGVLFDVETTGLDAKTDEPIEDASLSRLTSSKPEALSSSGTSLSAA